MLSPCYIRRKIKEKNEDAQRFLIRSLMKLELRTSLCAGLRSEKENRYKRVEQEFWLVARSLKSYRSGRYIQHKCVVHGIDI